jgi:uncharacterized protein (TIGR03435 family)
MSKRALLYVSVVAISLPVASGAQQTATFDVASIKRNLEWNQPGSGLAGAQPGGRFIGRGVTLRRLISDAYGMDVIGGPEWIGSDRFDVNAVVQGDVGPDDIRRMLRPLLADRFKLVVHTEAREQPVYVMTLARDDRRLGPNLKPSDPKCAAAAEKYFPTMGFPAPCGDFRMGPRELTGRGIPMGMLGGIVSDRVGRKVLDRTGLTGRFDLEMKWTTEAGLVVGPDRAGANDPAGSDGASIFTALQEQLGLKLEATRAPVDVLVVDRAEPPTPD